MLPGRGFPPRVSRRLYVQVLEVPARELVVRHNLNLAVAGLGDDNGVAKVARPAVDLDPLGQELLEGGDVEDLVVGGLRGIDDELEPLRQTGSACCAIRLGVLTFFVTLPLGPLPLAAFFWISHFDLAYCFTPSSSFCTRQTRVRGRDWANSKAVSCYHVHTVGAGAIVAFLWRKEVGSCARRESLMLEITENNFGHPLRAEN